MCILCINWETLHEESELSGHHHENRICEFGLNVITILMDIVRITT